MAAKIQLEKFFPNECDHPHFKSAGVYLFEIGQRFYVGSSIEFRERALDHIANMKRGKHHNPKVQCAYSKHQNVAFHIVEIVENPTREKLIWIEQSYLDNLVDDPMCLNVSRVAELPNYYCRPVIYDGRRFESSYDLARHLGVFVTVVPRWLSGKTPVPARFSADLRYETGDHGLVYQNPRSRIILINGKPFGKISDVCKKFGVSYTTVPQWISGRAPIPERYGISSIQYEGFENRSRINPKSRPVIVNGTMFPTCTDAAKSIGVQKTLLGNWLRGTKIPVKYNIHELRYVQ
jgi:DNA-binding transcriptional regulator YdaS (Cro superfamily)